VRRLFSTFAPGWPGAGLLILRVVAGTALISHALSELSGAQTIQPAIVKVAAIITGALLSVGLWTPVIGCLVSAFAFWNLISKAGDPWGSILLAAVGVALAMVGPGMWSLDARLFGWRRFPIRDREG
jgi:uncharacterized membrane protein YphA (DoxX/SURF4 family)